MPVLLALVYLPLLLRLRFPLGVLIATVAGSAVTSIVVPGFVPLLCVWFAVYTVAVHCDRARASVGLLLAAVPIALSTIEEVNQTSPELQTDALIVSALAGSLVTLGVFGVGRWGRWSVIQRRRIAELAAAQAISEERNRIARELHDVTAHAVSLMVLQAAGAARILGSDPARAQTALDHVETLGSQAIVELHRMLTVLEAAHGSGSASETPGVADVDTVVTHMRSAGFKITKSTSGTERPLPASTDFCAYRIVQEALTNASKHGHESQPIILEIEWTDDLLRLAITNAVGKGRARASALSTQRGLLGMKERAAAVDGAVDAGLTAADRFTVTAHLPVPPLSSSRTSAVRDRAGV